MVIQQLIYYNKTCQILMGMFNLGLKMLLAKRGVDFKDFALMEGYAGIDAYDPNPRLHELNRQFQALSPELQQQIRKSTFSDFMAMTGLDDFQSSFSTFIEQFGHLSDNGNDFSVTPWREAPDMVKQLITDFVPDKQNSSSRIRASEIRMGLWMRALYERAREFRFLREQVSSMYTFGYGLFRYYYLAMGRTLARRGWIEMAEDVFYLIHVQVKPAMLSPEPLADYRGLVRGHKLDIERYRNIPLPSTIYGDTASPILDPSLEKLVGIPTSVGCYTGRTVSVRGIRDFPKVHQGDVLVIPYSDVSWTPLFARVGAVISESGGLLSHSSIVAREYNIPAVVSAEGAMRLEDQTLVTVNGQTGEIVIHPPQ
jgi:pyruvate,water dikinase